MQDGSALDQQSQENAISYELYTRAGMRGLYISTSWGVEFLKYLPGRAQEQLLRSWRI